MTDTAAPDPQPGTPAQPSPDGRWRRAMMPLGKMARRTPRRP